MEGATQQIGVVEDFKCVAIVKERPEALYSGYS
jgi:hypothetical protein